MSTLRDAMSHAALGWVKPELDETLRQVRNEVEYFAEDPADTSRMRICAGYLHQVQGTLRMVELYAPALVAEELEQLANAIGGGQVQDRDESCATLMRGSVLLPDYLERLQNGHRDIPIVLLPLLNEIRAARGAPGINESVLFAFAPESATASQEELEHARGSLSGRNRELLDTVGNAVKEELLRIKDALDLHLRTGGQPQQLQQQVDELAAVGDTLAMMGLGVARSVVVQQRDALASVVEGTQQIDENMLLDIAGALLYVDASLDDQVAHLGAAGSGEDDPAAAETRRTVEVLAHEAIANFSAAREHFVAFIETNWNHAELQDVPRLLGEVGGALRMLDLATAADYLRGVQQYIDIELIGRQRVPSGRQLDTLADAMASLEYYLEALRDRRPGREDILDITRSSLEALRYWPLPAVGAQNPQPAVADAAGRADEPLSLQPIEREAVATPAPAVQAPSLQDLDVAPAPLRAAVPPPLPDFTFDPPLDTAVPPAAAGMDVPGDGLQPPAKAAPALLFDASSAPPPAEPLWHVGELQTSGRRVADDGNHGVAVADPQSPTLDDAGTLPHWALTDVEPAATAPAVTGNAPASANPFDPVGAEHPLPATETSLQAFASPEIAAAAAASADLAGGYPAQAPDVELTFSHESRDSDDTILRIDGSAFDPVLAEQDGLSVEAEAVTFRFEEGELSNADGVLSLADVASDTFDLPEFVPAAVSASLPVADDSASSSQSAVDKVDRVDGDLAASDEEQAHARFLAELDAAAAAFDPFAGSAPAAEPVAPPVDDIAPATAAAQGFEGGFDDQAENIDQDIRDVFLEEFEEELGNLGGLIAVWRLQPDNVDRLRPIRRVFHTLKGSGRLVGARTLGEFAWKVESLLNRVLDGSRPASPAVLALVGQAHEALPELYAALAHGQRIGVDLQALQAIADRVAAGEETFHIPLPARAPAETAAEADQVEQGTAEAPLQAPPAADGEPPAAGAPANIDGVLREILEAEVQAHLLTLNGWLQTAHAQPQPVNDALLRSMHTMNGAFAMTDVPEITAVTAAAESYIKRALAAAEVPGSDALSALADAARAIEDTMRVLQHEQPRVPFQHVLAARLQALAETLPEARWQALVDVEDEAPLADAQDDAIEAVTVDVETTGAETVEAEAAAVDANAAEASEAEAVEAEAVEAEAVEAEAIEAEAVEAEAIEAEAVEAEAVEAEATEAEAVEAEATEAEAVEAEAIEAEAIEADAVEAEAVEAETVEAEAVEAEAIEAEAVEAEAVEAKAIGAEAIEAEAVEAETVEAAQVHAPADDVHPALPAAASIAAADLSAYLDPSYAGQLSSNGAATPPGVDAEPAADTDTARHSGEPAVELTTADDLSAFFDSSAAAGSVPGLDSDADEPLQDDALAADDREFDDAVSLQEALDEGLHVIEAAEEGFDDETQSITLSPHHAAARDDLGAEDDHGAGTDGDSEFLADDISTHAPLFEMEAPVAAPIAQPAAEAPAAPVALDGLDFQLLDRELVDIFVEEGNDLLDHCDGLVSELRNAPDDREALAGLQRDLHTLKGGARMAGINAIGDLGHSIESLLEAVAAGRTSIERSDVQLLERGFDRLHKQLTLTGEHRQALPADDLLAELEARTLGQASSGHRDDVPAAAVDVPAPVQPLSAPVPLDAPVEDDGQPRPQQEQVRVRADLLDRLVNHAGEVAIYRSRLEQQLGAFRGAMGELERTNARLRDQLRRLDLETEAQIVARYQREQDHAEQKFDPLELDRFSTLQQLSRALNESAADLGGLQGVLDDLSRQYDGLLQQQSRVSSELQDGLMRARMVPFDGLVPRLRRVVRQAGLDTGKQVHLTLDGTHGELDRNVLDRMVAPLEHMLRNSVAHGLETPEQRRSAGKPEEGRIDLRLRREGSEVVLEVADDGAGLDREAIRRRALERGLIEENAALEDSQLDNLIFAAGFSTADQVSQLAGRGVGMDVVRNEVRQLGGTVDIHSVRGQGVRFTLRLPQTLAVTQAVLVQIGETTFAVPVASVSGIGRIARERFEAGEGTYRYSGEDFTLYDLGSLVGQAPARADGHDQVPLLLVRAGDLRAAVAIDQVLGNREIVVKPVGLQIASVPGIYGATITGDGRVVVILDVAPLVRRFVANPHRPQPVAEQAQQRQVPLVMVVDDSLTMRKVTGRILERHNFEVSVARDGVEALERLEERVPDLMLLDIEMPRMDGYELATAMRADPRFREVPIVMITSRSGEKHRQRAFEIGVQRYLGKPYQELDLMRNVYDLLGIARVRE